jgi:regulatory protein
MARTERGGDLRRIAMDLLARREHSSAELKAKLRARGAGDDDIAPVVERLGADGLQSDARYAEALARSLVSRGKGPVRIRAELRARGVGDDVIAEAMRGLDAQWDELARAVRSRRFGETLPATRDERARQARFLEQRGFAAEHIRAALAS